MSLNLISDDEVVIVDDARYVKMSTRRDVEEIFAEIMNDKYRLRLFYEEFGKKVVLFQEHFSHINNMTPAERVIRLATLPPIPTFLLDTRCIYLKINKSQFNIISKLARMLNTEMSNMTRILFYVSIPHDLHQEFPYLIEHYRFTEQIINYYLGKTDSEKRLHLYDELKN